MTLEEWTKHKATLEAVVLDHVELGEDPCGPRDNATGTEQLVQVELPTVVEGWGGGYGMVEEWGGGYGMAEDWGGGYGLVEEWGGGYGVQKHLL